MGFTNDDADRLITVTDAANNSTAYDTENNLSSITDANGHTTSFEYNPRASSRWALSGPLLQHTEKGTHFT